MDVIFVNSASKQFDPSKRLLNLKDKKNLKKSDIYAALSKKFLLHMKNYKGLYKTNKFKISAPTWTDKFELPNESFSLSDIQDYFDDIFKKHETMTDHLPNKSICKRKIH